MFSTENELLFQEEVPNNDEVSTSPEKEEINLSFHENQSNLDVSLTFHDYACVGVPEVQNVRNQSQQTSYLKVDAMTQTHNDEYYEYSTTGTQTVIINTYQVGIQADRPPMTYEDVKDNKQKLMFYTGFPDKETFDAVFDEIKSDALEQTTGVKKSETGRPRSLRLVDEFFMVLMRLRLGLLLDDLADRFRIGTSTCSNIFNRWIDYLDVQLSFLVSWPSRENIDATMPLSFRSKFPKCRVVIDCTEIRTETPSSLQLRSVLYSDYKSHMTYKSLIGISPAGVVTFVSDLYAGSISDKQITNLSGLVNQCNVGDAIMADKGFVINDLTTPKGVELIMPPFKKKNRQLSKREVNQTRAIANLRIHVERQMERIKNFKILQGIMPITMAPQVSKIWKICVRLTNLQPQLVAYNS